MCDGAQSVLGHAAVVALVVDCEVGEVNTGSAQQQVLGQVGHLRHGPRVEQPLDPRTGEAWGHDRRGGEGAAEVR